MSVDLPAPRPADDADELAGQDRQVDVLQEVLAALDLLAEADGVDADALGLDDLDHLAPVEDQPLVGDPDLVAVLELGAAHLGAVDVGPVGRPQVLQHEGVAEPAHDRVQPRDHARRQHDVVLGRAADA